MKLPLHWLLHTDAGLLVRVLIGTAIFFMLAGIYLYRNGPAARRWREYSVLIAAVLAALAYGTINDQVTVTISPEYFLYGKELYKIVGDNPTMETLRWEAAKVGFKATWSAGLIFGVALLLANNPYRHWVQLRNRELMLWIPVIVAMAAILGAVGGWLGYRGGLAKFDSDFQDLLAADIYRPYRFMATWGVHLGGYVGGLIGTAIAVIGVIRRRISLQKPEHIG